MLQAALALKAQEKYVDLMVGTIPDLPNIHNMLTIPGHRFRHPSGLDESSGRNSTTSLHGIAFLVYLVFPETRTIIKDD